MNGRHILVSSLLLMFLCSNLSAQSPQKRGPSTPEERAKAVQIARALEADSGAKLPPSGPLVRNDFLTARQSPANRLQAFNRACSS